MEQSFRWNSNGDSRNPGTLIAWMLSGDAKQEKKLICSGKNWALLHRSGMCIPDLKSQPSRVSIRTSLGKKRVKVRIERLSAQDFRLNLESIAHLEMINWSEKHWEARRWNWSKK
jgi:hypothetical protein